MSGSTESPRPDATDIDQSTAGSLLRMFWLAYGNAGLLIAAALVSKQPPWTYTVTDAIYGALVVALLLARFLDITRFGGLTSNNEPATKGHLVRYSVGLVVIATLLWIGAQSIQT